MHELLSRLTRFKEELSPAQQALYQNLARHGQQPKTLIISCADSRVVPEQIIQAGPGELFVCRNTGNIVPPFSQANGGVTSTVEYAVMALGVTDIIVCGHSDCGAMKAVANPVGLEKIPNVAAWLHHSQVAAQVVEKCHPNIGPKERVRAICLENVVAQLAHLRTHPSVAAGIARGDISLHGWFFDIGPGQILALDGASGRFEPVTEGRSLPIAHKAEPRLAADFCAT